MLNALSASPSHCSGRVDAEERVAEQVVEFRAAVRAAVRVVGRSSQGAGRGGEAGQGEVESGPSLFSGDFLLRMSGAEWRGVAWRGVERRDYRRAEEKV